MDDTNRVTAIRTRILNWLMGPQLLAFMPAACLASYWLFGDVGLLAASFGVPVCFILLGAFSEPVAYLPARQSSDLDSGQFDQDTNLLLRASTSEDRTAVILVQLDDAESLAIKLAGETSLTVQDAVQSRLSSQLRGQDVVARVSPFRWAIALCPGPRLDLESAIQHASRLQTITDEPILTGEHRLYFTASVGFALAACTDALSASDLRSKAESALSAALGQGKGSIRAYSDALVGMPHLASSPSDTSLSHENEQGLVAWYQPQISTDTGEVTGFEALARWNHPEHGLLMPAQFLPSFEQSGRLERLTELMLFQALNALQLWDDNDLSISTVGVNFSLQDLSNPKLYEKIAWDLDRFDIPPHRLAIEVLESVVAGETDDVIARNVKRLSELGCQIDLDDFGTGHASISTLRRLPVTRLKIDRSFVAKADVDSEQQKMVSTILIMAERLGLTCLAEGVETLGEHTILAQLGCRYVQGYGIARPMPLDATVGWANDYQSKLSSTPLIGRSSA